MVNDEVDDRYNKLSIDAGDYDKQGINLIVETVGNEMKLTHSNMNAHQVWELIIFLIDKLSRYSGVPYNDVVEDLKEKI